MAHRDPRRLSRRQFAVLGTQVSGAVVAVLLGIPIVGFLISPLFRQQQVVWRKVGDIAGVPDGGYFVQRNWSGYDKAIARRVQLDSSVVTQIKMSGAPSVPENTGRRGLYKTYPRWRRRFCRGRPFLGGQLLVLLIFV